MTIETERWGRRWLTVAALVGATAGVLATGPGCSEGESDLFNPGSTRGLDAPLDTLDTVTIGEDRSYRSQGESGQRSSLLLLRQPEYSSVAYMLFDVDNVDEDRVITSVSLSVRLSGGTGDEVAVDAHEVDPSIPEWTENEIPLEGPPLLADPVARQTDTVGFNPDNPDSALVQLKTDILSFPVSLIERWLEEPETNRGIGLQLQSDNMGSIVLLSSEAVAVDDDAVVTITPELTIDYEGEGVLNLEPVQDGYLIFDNRAPEPGDAPTLLLDQEIASRALIRPDLSGLDLERGDTIHRAELFLRIVPGTYEYGPDEPFSVGVYANRGPWTEAVEPDTVSRAAFATDVIEVEEDTEVLRLDFGTTLQDWIDGEEDNDGLTLRILGEGLQRAKLQVYSSEADSAAFRPRIEVVASRPLDPRWEDSGQ